MVVLRSPLAAKAPLVKCVKSCKLIMGSGKAIPSEPTLARSPRQASEVGGEGCGAYPLGGPERASGGRLQSLPLRLFQECQIGTV
jgi:hypothetical protein